MLDPRRNESGKGRISTEASSVPVWVISTDEERLIARHTMRVLETGHIFGSET
jgi:acetate kinase